jgi:hypothetical protein
MKSLFIHLVVSASENDSEAKGESGNTSFTGKTTGLHVHNHKFSFCALFINQQLVLRVFL